MLLRRFAPWMISLAVHAGLVLLVPVGSDLRGMRVPVPERRVVLVFDDTDAVPTAPAASSPSGPSIAASALSMPSSLPLPTAAALDPVADTLRASSTRVETVPGGVPSAREVLASLPATSVAPATGAARTDAAAAEPTVRIGWTGAARTVVRSVNPRFPAILSETGQEAEVGARITVTPLGAVVDVEITLGSGYTEIDAAVETALRQWIFSRSEGKQNAIGTVSYRFPLEKRD
ncbi:MAG: TonB family protein [Spirochaetes bacterium]|nr:TonB family protein [Spirochaetota bacterium]